MENNEDVERWVQNFNEAIETYDVDSASNEL